MQSVLPVAMVITQVCPECTAVSVVYGALNSSAAVCEYLRTYLVTQMNYDAECLLFRTYIDRIHRVTPKKHRRNKRLQRLLEMLRKRVYHFVYVYYLIKRRMEQKSRKSFVE